MLPETSMLRRWPAMLGQCVCWSLSACVQSSPVDDDPMALAESDASGGGAEIGTEVGESTSADTSANTETESGSEAADTAVEGGTIGDDAEHNLVFVTSRTYVPGQLGSLEAADALCQTHADEVGLPGRYVAWLSTKTVSAAERLEGAQGWLRVDGLPFAASSDDLFAMRTLYPVALDEFGRPTDAYVLTGSNPEGQFADRGTDCEAWTSTVNDEGVLTEMGDPNRGSALWTSSYGGQCRGAAALVCFGVDSATPVKVIPSVGRRAFVIAGPRAVESGGAWSELIAPVQRMPLRPVCPEPFGRY